jgi:hypothetical protein
MNDFINVRNHPRYSSPNNVGDMFVKDRLDKYLSQREKLLANKRYDLNKISEIEAKNLMDDFDFWWYKVDSIYINRLIKLYKSEAKLNKK